MLPKPHRAIAQRASTYADEALAYLRRRRHARRPFARVYVAGGHVATQTPDSEAGRALFIAAARLIETGRE